MKVSKIILKVYTVLFLYIVFCGEESLMIFKYASEIMAFSSIILLVGKWFCKKKFGKIVDKGIVVIYICIFLFIIVDYLFWSIYPDSTLSYVKRFAFYLPMMLVALDINEINNIINLSKKYVFLIAFVFIIKYPIQGVNGSFLGSYQYVGSALSIGMLFYVADFIFKEKYENKDLITFLFLLGTLLMTGKRTFTVIPIGLLLLYIGFNTETVSQKKKCKRFLRLLVPAIFIGSIILIIKPDLLLVMSRLAEASQDESMNGRTGFWKLAMYLWSENKTVGIGMGTFQDFIANNIRLTYAMFRVQVAYAAHNIYYQMLAEVGVIGFCLFVLFFVYNLFTTIQLIKNENVRGKQKLLKCVYISISIQIWFLLYGYTGNPLYMLNQFYIYLFAIMIIQSIKRELRYS